jgi:hypothetical protein
MRVVLILEEASGDGFVSSFNINEQSVSAKPALAD